MIKVFFEVNDIVRLDYFEQIYKVNTGTAKTTEWGEATSYMIDCKDFFELDDIISECFCDGQQAVMISIDARVFFVYDRLKVFGENMIYQGLLFSTNDLEWVKEQKKDYSVFDNLVYFISNQ